LLALRITDNRSWGEKSEKFSPGAPPPDPRFICAILILFKFAQALSGKSVECTVFGVRNFFLNVFVLAFFCVFDLSSGKPIGSVSFSTQKTIKPFGCRKTTSNQNEQNHHSD
jgi:hypothetical protein